MSRDPEELYDETAKRWARLSPTSLSDFTGRPVVVELAGDVTGRRVLDAGCGEGYVSRLLAAKEARVTGIDVSKEMIDLAESEEAERPRGIRYLTGDVRDLPFEDGSFDLAVAVFVFNYLTIDDTARALAELRRVIAPGGALVFAIPHPTFPLMRGNEPPFYFDLGDRGYFSARDERCEGEIWRIDGSPLAVQVVHKTFTDYFEALARAGFSSLPVLRELRVLDEHVDSNPEFFGPIRDVPLHVAFRIER